MQVMKEEAKNVSEIESKTIEKECGQTVHFLAEVKNTCDAETTYVIIAKWRNNGTEKWETAGLKSMKLGPGKSETLAIGPVECTKAMIGKYFDTKFILSCGETILDEKEIEKAWYVKEVIAGVLTGFQIE